MGKAWSSSSHGADAMVQRMVKHEQVNTVTVKVSSDAEVGETKQVEVPVTRGVIILSDLRRAADNAAITSIRYDAPSGGPKDQTCRTSEGLFPPDGPKGSWEPWPVLVACENPPNPPSPKAQRSKICVIKDEEKKKKDWKKIELTRDWYIKKEDLDVCCGVSHLRLWSWNDNERSFVENPVETIIHPPREAAARAWLHPEILPTYSAKM